MVDCVRWKARHVSHRVQFNVFTNPSFDENDDGEVFSFVSFVFSSLPSNHDVAQDFELSRIRLWSWTEQQYLKNTQRIHFWCPSTLFCRIKWMNEISLERKDQTEPDSSEWMRFRWNKRTKQNLIQVNEWDFVGTKGSNRTWFASERWMLTENGETCEARKLQSSPSIGDLLYYPWRKICCCYFCPQQHDVRKFLHCPQPHDVRFLCVS